TTWMSGDEELDELEELDAAPPPNPPPPPPAPVPVPVARVDDDVPEAVAVTVVDVPPVPPLARFSPTVTFTCATVPSNDTPREPPASACSARVAVWVGGGE